MSISACHCYIESPLRELKAFIDWWVGKNVKLIEATISRLLFELLFFIYFWKNSELKTEQESFSFCIHFLVGTESLDKCAL